MKKQKLMGILTCPSCHHQQQAEIPLTTCVQSYRCNGCQKTISATKDCCVFCDYGDRPCPVGHKK